MFSSFKAKQPKPFYRFEIYWDANCEYGVQVNSPKIEGIFDLNSADMFARSYFKHKRYPNIEQAEKGIDYILGIEGEVLRKK